MSEAQSKVQSLEGIINFSKYPFQDPKSDGYGRLLQECRSKLDHNGACEFTDFLTSEGLLGLIAESKELAKNAYFNTVNGNAYLEATDMILSEDHPRRMTEDTSLGVIAYDEYPANAILRRIYEYEPLMNFIGAVLGLKSIYRYADPMGGLNLSVMKDGDYLRWHFDQTDFVTSLAIQSADVGGEFEFVPMVRNEQNENYDGVRQVLKGTHPGIIKIANTPGTLVLFKGRYSIHRVSKIHGPEPRLIGLLAYDERPDVNSTDHLRKMRYGRTSPYQSK